MPSKKKKNPKSGDGLRVAVVGATGLVGREIIEVLQQRAYPVRELLPLASERSAGERIEWQDTHLTVQKTEPSSFENVDIVLMSAGGTTSKEIAPIATEAGAIVVDNSSQWRMHPEVPLVVPEVNAEDALSYGGRRIIANPNCSTIQMVVALAPLHEQAELKRVVVATYQAVSGKGKAAMDELGAQVAGLFGQKEAEIKEFQKRIAFNCIPAIDVFLEDDYTKEERKMRDETRKILHLPDVGVCATCVRVPVFNGHAEAVVAEFAKPLNADQAREILRQAPGVIVQDNPADQEYPTPIDCDGSDATFVGRIRADDTTRNSLAFWCVSDNLRKGAATNAVQIAELLLADVQSRR